jgi:microcompartment protein CcmK/EutM
VGDVGGDVDAVDGDAGELAVGVGAGHHVVLKSGESARTSWSVGGNWPAFTQSPHSRPTT